MSKSKNLSPADGNTPQQQTLVGQQRMEVELKQPAQHDLEFHKKNFFSDQEYHRDSFWSFKFFCNRKTFTFCSICSVMLVVVFISLLYIIIIPTVVYYELNNGETGLQSIYLVNPQEDGTFGFSVTLASASLTSLIGMFGISADITSTMSSSSDIGGGSLYSLSNTGFVNAEVYPKTMTFSATGSVLDFHNVQQFQKLAIFTNGMISVNVFSDVIVKIRALMSTTYTTMKRTQYTKGQDNFTHPIPNTVDSCTSCSSIFEGYFCLEINATAFNAQNMGVILDQGVNFTIAYKHQIFAFGIVPSANFYVGESPLTLRVYVPFTQPTEAQLDAFTEMTELYFANVAFNVTVNNLMLLDRPVPWLQDTLDLVELNEEVSPRKSASSECPTVETTATPTKLVPTKPTLP